MHVYRENIDFKKGKERASGYASLHSKMLCLRIFLRNSFSLEEKLFQHEILLIC